MPEIGIVGLHAENLGIGSVLVDGEAADFEYYPRQNHVESEKRWSAVSTPSSAADAAGAAYVSALERELVPNLLINCCKGFKSGSDQQAVAENGFHSSGETKQQVIVSICVLAFFFFFSMMKLPRQGQFAYSVLTPLGKLWTRAKHPFTRIR